jgi:hypothetical protein
MAYERYGTRDFPRDERSRWRDEPFEPRGRREDRGLFERAGDEVASWFGDEEAERRRREDQRMGERERGYGREWDRGSYERDEDRLRGSRWTGRDVGSRQRLGDRDFERERGYRPTTGDYSRGSEQFFAASGVGREREPASRDYDPHYHSWRQRHMSELDRDYDEYRREHQAQFERDFGSWRERRMHKRGLLDQIREQMEVIGNDDSHVGTIARVAGDRIILTRSDPESGGVHHSLSCSDIDRVESDRVILDLDSEQARQRWRDESRSRALFEREDQGEMGPGMLGRSFEGTYR